LNYSDYLDFYPLNDNTYAVGAGRCIYLNEVEIPEKYKGIDVTRIAYNGFYINEDYENKYLTSIKMPDSITIICDYAFYNCISLDSIEFGNSVTVIGKEAFYNCAFLESISLPKSIESIGSEAFYNCSSLASITYNGTKSEWNNITKGESWDTNIQSYVVHCTDGDIN